MIELLSEHQFVLWFHANEWRTFEEDLMTSALHLKNELLRFDSAPADSQEGGESRRYPRLYWPDAGTTSLTKTLEVWTKSMQDEPSRILVVLDDLDGLDVAHHQKISRMFAPETVELIYTGRDPSIADTGMIWEAQDFEVPVLQGEHAAAMLEDFMRASRLQRHNQKSSELVNEAAVSAKIAEVVNHVGALPSAIITASHYVKDHSSSMTTLKSLEWLIHNWDSGQMLQFRRDTAKYIYTVLESFDVSKSRLQRNTQGKPIQDLYRLSLTVLALLSVLHLISFELEHIDVLCKALGEFARRRSEMPLDVDLQFLSENCTIMNRCITELTRVSLLSGPDAHGRIQLHILTISCVLLTPKEIISHVKRWRLEDFARYFTSRLSDRERHETSISTGELDCHSTYSLMQTNWMRP